MTSPYIRDASDRLLTSKAPIPMTTEKLKFAKLIRSQRLAQGMSARELAEKAGVKSDLIWKVEDGATNPRLRTIAGLVTALDIPADDLREALS